jgi:hypothetical protein
MSRAHVEAGRSSRSAVALDPASHTHARRFRTDSSSPRKLNLRKLAREGGINRGGLQSVESRQVIVNQLEKRLLLQ